MRIPQPPPLPIPTPPTSTPSPQCQIDQNFPDHLPRKLTVSGEPDNVRLAVDMVKAVIAEVG